jgi:hypothetical protein
MRQLNGVYTQRFNRIHGRVGHVFQGRTRPFWWNATATCLNWRDTSC